MPSLMTASALFVSAYSPLLVVLVIAGVFRSGFVNGGLVIVAVLSVLALVTYLRMARKLAPYELEVRSLEQRGSEVAGYIVGYLLPFFMRDLSEWRAALALFVFFVVLAVIYVRSNLVYVNPVLALLGYQLYEVESSSGKRAMLISRRTFIPVGARLRVVALGNYVNLEVSNARS